MKINDNYQDIVNIAQGFQQNQIRDKLDFAASLRFIVNTALGILNGEQNEDKNNPFSVHIELKVLSRHLHRIANIAEKNFNSKAGEKWGSLLTPDGNFFNKQSLQIKHRGNSLQEIKESLQELEEIFERYRNGEMATFVKGIINFDGMRISIPEEIKKIHEVADEIDHHSLQFCKEDLTLVEVKKIVDKKLFTNQTPTKQDLKEAAKFLTYYLLESKDVQQDKEWIQQILKFINKQKHSLQILSNDNEFIQQRQALKELKTAALTVFKERINRQQEDLVTFWANFFHLQEQGQLAITEAEFVEKQLIRWTKKLSENKPVNFPKWYHCTPSSQALASMVNSEIEVRSEKGYLGAFVANRPEYGYGKYGIAMSDKIEETGTKKHTIMPFRAVNQGTVSFGNTNDHSKKTSILQWIGFQSSIPLKRSDKQVDPIGYYENQPIAYLFYKAHGLLSDELREAQFVEQKLNLPLVSGDHVEKMLRVINLDQVLVLPKEWEGHI